MEIQKLFDEMIETKSSDLHLKVGRPPMMRTDGELKPTEHPELTEDDVKHLAYSVLDDHDIRVYEANRELDTSFTYEDKARFRINMFYQQRLPGAVMRLIPLVIPTVEELMLPEVLNELALRKQGLILFTGPTGSGKSTSMAAMINHINKNLHRHVITIEDPIEFVHADGMCTFTQRELGTDTCSLQEALKRVLRQDPDVILVGEMRDPETMETAMQAAETGHLVFSTLHTNDAKQTMDRILESFEGNHQRQVRTLLSLNLLAVLAQRLVLRADGHGRIAALEIMVNSPHVSQILAKGETTQLEEAIGKKGNYWHMQTFNQALCRLVEEGMITAGEAIRNTSNPSDLRLMLRGVGIGSSEIDDLTKEVEAGKEAVLAQAVPEATPAKPNPPGQGFEF